MSRESCELLLGARSVWLEAPSAILTAVFNFSVQILVGKSGFWRVTIWFEDKGDSQRVSTLLFIFARKKQIAITSGNISVVSLTNFGDCCIMRNCTENRKTLAGLAELVDALDSGSSVRKDFGVQVPGSALCKGLEIRD